jgi:glycosyltransferase involved in cell wall biosynthesis
MNPQVCMLVHEHFPRDFRVRREARALVKAGYNVTVVSLKSDGQAAHETWKDIEIIRLPVKRHRGSPLPVYLAEYLAFCGYALFNQLAKSLNSRAFDVVHVHTPPDFLVAAAMPARMRGSKIILDIHDPTPELYGSRFKGTGGSLAKYATETVEQLSCGLADQVITVTDAFKEILVERGVPAEKISVVHNCPDPEIFRKPTNANKTMNDELVIIHHGTLLHRYGEDLLVRAFAKALPKIPKARLDIYGNGDLLPTLKKIVHELQIEDKVRFYGEVPQEEIAEALEKADLCVVPNRNDEIMRYAFPTKLLEALHMGCPVIASSTELVAKTFSDGGIFFTPPGDLESLSEAIIGLANDSAAREKLAKKGLKQAERFDWSREKEKLTGLYANL